MLENYAPRNVPTFTWVFPSDLLPAHPLHGLRYKIIDIHTEPSIHSVRPSSHEILERLSFRLIRTPRALMSYNTRALQGFTADVCGQCACLCVMRRPGAKPSSICRPVFDVGAGPAGGKGIRVRVWLATSAHQRRHPRRAVLYLQKRCLDLTCEEGKGGQNACGGPVIRGVAVPAK